MPPSGKYYIVLFCTTAYKYYISQHPHILRTRSAVVRPCIENHHKTLLKRHWVEVCAAILGGEVRLLIWRTRRHRPPRSPGFSKLSPAARQGPTQTPEPGAATRPDQA